MSKKERFDKKNGDRRGRNRPNYFVAIQVSDPEIVSNIKYVQKSIVCANPALEPALISLKKLHITVKVLCINSEFAMKRAIQAMENCRESLTEIMSSPLKLQFETLGDFNQKVLFATIVDKSQLEQLQIISDNVQSCFEARGFRIDDDLKPHVTIAKLSKAPQLWNQKIRKISEDTYKQHKEQSFGTEVVKSLQLLSMVDPMDENGYYHCVKEVCFAQDTQAGGDTTHQMPEAKSQKGTDFESNPRKPELRNTEAQRKSQGDTVHGIEMHQGAASAFSCMQKKADVSIVRDESVLEESEVHVSSALEKMVLK